VNALLAYPEFPDTFWSFRHALKFTGKRALLPPLGLLTVAAMLPEQWDKRLVDLNIGPLADADLRWADYVFISAMAVQRDSAQRVLERCRSAGVKVVAGGPLFTIDHQQFPQVDHFVLNEAELTLPPFLADLAAGAARRTYTSVEHADMTASPVPLWRLANLRRYAMGAVQFSRGCPFDCDFCNVTSLFGRRPRVKSGSQVIAELDELAACGWRGPVFFVDDNLIAQPRRLKEDLLPALVRWQERGRRVDFNTQASINLADDPELMALMVNAGFDTVFVGIETPSDEALASCGKKQNLGRDLLADVKRLQRAGLEVQGGFIVGFDTDTPSVFQRQVEFIQRSGIATAMVGLLQAVPGTRLHRRLEEQGRLRGQCTGDNVDGTSNIAPLMDPQTLRSGYERVLQSIYSPRAYYRRVRTFLREYHSTGRRTRIGRPEVVAFLRSLYRLGLFGRERLQYWKLLIWAVLRRPRLFGDAVSLAIIGHHYRKVSDGVLTRRAGRAAET
jgi:radical SAM superfamily enzyme YgiQ (UPF0313 family)